MEALTGLAGVSSRTCRLPVPQTDAEAATAWSSSGKFSTILIRTSQCPSSCKMREEIQHRNGGKYLKLLEV